MRVIILAAGKGSRLHPYTEDKPKCLVELEGRPILDYQLSIFDKIGIKNRVIVAGYLEDLIKRDGLKKIVNAKYDTTNMVYSLFCARDYFDDDIIISYGDIVYSEYVLRKLIDSDAEVSVVVDKDWERLWSMRMEAPENDVESMKIRDGKVVELGKPVTDITEVEGQYIGLVKIRKDFLSNMQELYDDLCQQSQTDITDCENMYMTSFIQMIIGRYKNVKPVFIQGGWAEVDTVSDIAAYAENAYISSIFP